MSDIAQLEDGVTAVQYGTPEGMWEPRALIKVAAFITGVDIEAKTMTEDQILDVVRPVQQFWDLKNNVADIEVITGKRILGMTLGQWLVKYPAGFYRVLSTNDYLSQVGPSAPALTFRQELQKLLNKHSIDARVGVHDFILASEVENHLTDLTHMMRSVRSMEEKA